MTRTWITLCISLILMGVGAGVLYYKSVVLSYPLTPEENTGSWYVEFSTQIMPARRNKSKSVEFMLPRPYDNGTYVVTNTQIVAPDFGVKEQSERGDQFYNLTKRSIKKDETIFLRYNVYKIDNSVTSDLSTPQKYDQYKKRNRLSNPDDTTRILYQNIDEIIDAAKELSAGPLSFTEQIILGLNDNQKVAKLIQDKMDAPSREAVIVNLLGAANIQARIANGFELQKSGDNIDIVKWVEIYHKNKWKRYSAETGRSKALNNYFLWWVGNNKIFEGLDNNKYSYNLSSKLNTDGSLMRDLWLAENPDSLLSFFSLQTLSLQQQFVVQILILLPLGALFVCFFRQIIGLQTFGTFMPVLIALAFRETGLLYGIGFFFIVICCGLIARSYITKLHLLMVPRLSVVLSVVVMFIIMMMLATKDQDISLGISVALFPVVIITMFIERMSTILDEKGPVDAFYGLIGSMTVATIIYLCVLNTYTMHLMFIFPELLLIVTALCLLLGRYNGYKLLEYWRFYQMKKALK